jgi:hypothetical protein
LGSRGNMKARFEEDRSASTASKVVGLALFTVETYVHVIKSNKCIIVACCCCELAPHIVEDYAGWLIMRVCGEHTH